MTKTKTNKTANNIMWVEAWIKQAHPSLEFEISADPYKNKWKCEFDIPTVNKKVTSISNIEVNAMLNAAKKARKLINEYLVNHPELKNIVDKYWTKNWEIKEDENGNFVSLSRKSKAIKQESERFVKNVGTVGKTIETAIEKIERLFNYHGSLNIQVIDKKLLGDNPDIQELEQKAWDNYKKMYGMKDDLPRWQTVCTTDDNIVFIRYQDKVIDMRKVN